MMQNLQGLQEQIQLPDELAVKLVELETKHKQAPKPSISHAQVNRLAKLRSQSSAIVAKVQVADQEWTQFMQGVLERVQAHANAYQVHRQSLMETLTVKQEELLAVKAEIQQASMSLSQGETLPTTVAPPDLGQQIQELQAMAAVSTSPVVLDDDEETAPSDALMEVQQEDPENKPILKVGPHTSYRVSPTRGKEVAKEHLKAPTGNKTHSENKKVTLKTQAEESG